MFRRYPKCYCMNNSRENSTDMLETKCDSVSSYVENNYNSCS